MTERGFSSIDGLRRRLPLCRLLQFGLCVLLSFCFAAHAQADENAHDADGWQDEQRSHKPEDEFGIVPAEDGSGLSIDASAEKAPKTTQMLKAWAAKRSELESGGITPEEYADWKAKF